MNNRKEGAVHRTMIDLFAGCGGLSLGFENAGFSPVFVSELNDDALDTYLRNRQHELSGLRFSDNPSLRCKDANELKGKRLQQLISDLKCIRSIDFHFDTSSKKNGAGSTLDIVTGGPPCQGFSTLGIRRSYDVHRKNIPSNHLYGRMVKIIRRLRPRIFLFENVRGILNAKWTRKGREKVWTDVKAEFNKIPGYSVRWSVVFAKDYGVPQNRPRVFLVGIRQDILESPNLSDIVDPMNDPEDAVACGFLPQAQSQTYPDLVDLLGDLVDHRIPRILRRQEFPEGPFQTGNYPRPPKPGSIQEWLRAPPDWTVGGAVTLTEQEYSKHRLHVVAKFDVMLKNGGDIPQEFITKKFSQRVLRKRWGRSSPNITAASLPDDYVHYSQPRILTVREWARLQMFPDWYQFSGRRTTGGIQRAGNPKAGLFERDVPKYTQIGNAVPVRLAENIASHLRNILDEACG